MSKEDTSTAQAAHIEDLRAITHRLLDVIGQPEAKPVPRVESAPARLANINDAEGPITAFVVYESDTHFRFDAVRNSAGAVRGSTISAIIWVTRNAPAPLIHALRACLRLDGIETYAEKGDSLVLPRSCPTDSPPRPQ